MRLRNIRDLLAGCMFVSFGLAFLYFAQDYQLGSARRMGPAYFPVVLALILIGIGLATVARAFVVAGAPIRDVPQRVLSVGFLMCAARQAPRHNSSPPGRRINRVTTGPAWPPCLNSHTTLMDSP